MTAPYRLHVRPPTTPRFVCGWRWRSWAWAYHTALVDRAARGQRAPAYLALNPNGLIPVLETPGRARCSRPGAILLWLADRHGGAGPRPPDHADRGAVLSWTLWLS